MVISPVFFFFLTIDIDYCTIPIIEITRKMRRRGRIGGMNLTVLILLIGLNAMSIIGYYGASSFAKG